MTTIVTEPARGGFFDPEMLALSGREQMEAAVAGKMTRPPMHHLTGMKPTAAGEGTSRFEMPATGWLASQYGLIPGGMLAVLADGPLGCAIQSTLPPATPYTTAELSMSYLRPAFPDGRPLVADGRLIHAGRTLALSDAVVRDADGREVAHATSRCFIFPSIPLPPPRPASPPVTYDTPDPYLRPPVGTVLGPEAESMSGYEMWRGCVSGDLPAPPLYHLTGARPTDVEEGRVTWAMPATKWLCSPTGMVEGGFLVYLADAALASACATLAPAGTAAAPVDITVKFLRPAPPDGRDLTAEAHVVNHGRSLSVATAAIRNADGKLVATALGSSMLLEKRSFARPVVVEEESP